MSFEYGRFILFRAENNYSAAAKRCRAVGDNFRLATITTKYNMDRLREKAQSYFGPLPKLWRIGLRYPVMSDVGRWPNGEALDTAVMTVSPYPFYEASNAVLDVATGKLRRVSDNWSGSFICSELPSVRSSHFGEPARSSTTAAAVAGVRSSAAPDVLPAARASGPPLWSGVIALLVLRRTRDRKSVV